MAYMLEKNYFCITIYSHMNIVFLLSGLVLILLGANMLTDGSAALARRWGVSDLVVGLTVVAFGTSAPEFVISVLSAVNGNPELAIGNVVGSNIFNVLVIVGVTAMIRPIVVQRSIMTADIPLVIVSALVLLAMGSGPLLGGGSVREISRADGIILLLFFAIFMRYTFAQAKNGPADSDTTPDSGSAPQKEMSMTKSLIWIALGLAGLVFGGEWFVDGASGIASSLGVSDAVIGLTIVAAGTSLPELATSVVSAIKGKPGLAIGNVIGSNIMNIFFILGTSATISPLKFGAIGEPDLLALTAACLLFWFFGWFFRKRTITRIEGAILALSYVSYTTWLVVNA